MVKSDMAPENAHDEGIEGGMLTGTFALVRVYIDRKIDPCIFLMLPSTYIIKICYRFTLKCPELCTVTATRGPVSGYPDTN